MRTPPVELAPSIVDFQPPFSECVRDNAQDLLTGPILAIGERAGAGPSYLFYLVCSMQD
jgi:hypothetical protein